uniref:Integrase, catalytic region, zinc finger, CCHC-type, peptidase aspartic, catalytic n=1 Tax=Tanacetum cinerariifolium TaxID=118510 RepID=A0A6L2LLX9_TANCI|nr:hypothetical protein [Tanacetum cinerariifolium]
MATTDKESSAASTDNRLPMLVESDYESWKILSRVTEGQGAAAVQVTRDKTDEQFTEIENNRELADIQATNILSQGLPRHVFNILNQTRTGKEIWDNVEFSNERTSSNSRSHATVHNGQIITKTVQRKALGNVGNTDAEAEAFLFNVECRAPYDQLLAITTTNIFEVSHEDAYDSDVDKGPHAAAAFMANLSSTNRTNGATTSHVNEYQLDSEVQDVPTEAKIAQPTLYDGHALLKPTNTPVSGHGSKESLVQAEVSRTMMSNRPGKIKPINYVELNAMYSHFVPQKELSQEQVYWLPAEELATQKSNPPKPVTPFIHTRPVSKVHTQLLKLKDCFPAFETIIKRRITPTFHEQGEWHFVHTKKAFTEQVIPFYELVKELVQSLDENLVKEVTEFMRIFNELDKEYEQCVLKKKKLQIEKKNLLIQNECLITDCIAKDICSIVLAFDRDRPLSEEISLNYVRENSKVIELEAEILKQQQMLDELDKRYAMTSVRIQNDGFKVENVNLKRHYQELSTSNSHSRDTLTRKLTTLTTENAKLKSESLSKIHSEPIVPEKPKVLARGMYPISTPRPSNRTTQKRVVQQNKKPNVHVNLSTGVKPATRASKPISNSDTQNHSTLPAKREKTRRVEDHHRNLNKQNHVDSRLNVKRTGFVSNSNTVCNTCNESLVFANHDNCVVCNLKYVNVKTLTAKHNVKTTKKVWKAKVVTVRSQWKPTGRRFTLYDEYPLTRIVEPIFEPLELTPCVSSNSKVTMISRFTNYKLSNRKAGSKGISGIFEC